MKTLTFLTFLAFSNLCFARPFTTINSTAELKEYLVKKKFNGVVLVADKEKVLLKEAFGFRNLNSQEKLEADDLFQIGSTTKQMVALGILKLQDAGKISIDQKLKNYVSVPESYSEIKIKDILNHTSGITNFTDRQEFWEKLDAETILSHQDIINFINLYPLDFETRTKWQYSNSGYIFAGKIIEDISGHSWDKFLAQNIFQPLQMNHTGYALNFEKVSSVKGNVRIKGDVYQQVDDFNLSWALAAGALYSNAEDMVKWLRNYSNNTLITTESMNEMLTPYKKNYGLGVIIQNKDGDQFITHEGRTPGYVTQIGQLKIRGLSFVSFDNKDGAGGDIRSLLYNLFVKGKAEAIKPETIAVTVVELQEYVGTYSDGSLVIKVYERDGELFMFPEGQREIGTRAVDKDEFDLEGFAAEEFIRDENGKIKAMKHYQGEHTSTFSRLQ
jgi:CubicO group peptidase (beta-lactamase class C family)